MLAEGSSSSVHSLGSASGARNTPLGMHTHRGMYYSFASTPKLELRATPLGGGDASGSGGSLGEELPGLLVGALQTHLLKVCVALGC